jgi:pyridoxamine 5'-phosphate oxidase
MKTYLSKLRKDYKMMALSEDEAGDDPIKLLEKWLSDAANNNVSEPNAMVLSTVDAQGIPYSRVLLLRNLEQKGLSFYTNYQSEKGMHLAHNPHAAINFFWVDMERQVRIVGKVEKISVMESNEYFQSRPRQNQISAWASPQSEVVSNREALEARFREFEQKFEGLQEIEKPPFWGGYRLSPSQMEFWQGRPGRLHDRIRFSLDEDQNWKRERLGP